MSSPSDNVTPCKLWSSSSFWEVTGRRWGGVVEGIPAPFGRRAFISFQFWAAEAMPGAVHGISALVSASSLFFLPYHHSCFLSSFSSTLEQSSFVPSTVHDAGEIVRTGLEWSSFFVESTYNMGRRIKIKSPSRHALCRSQAAHVHHDVCGRTRCTMYMRNVTH